jgi:mono/diheme cytochrome c family protein
MRRRLAAMLLCGLSGEGGAAGVSFARDVVPLFKSRCVMCHLPDSPQGGLALHPHGGYAELVGVPSTQSPLPRVRPGDAQRSYLFHKIAGTHAAVGGGERMPFGDALSAEQIERVRQWIDGGARDD